MNLFKKLFNDPSPITWHDPAVEQPKRGAYPQPPVTEQDRAEAHQMIDQVLGHNPGMAKRAHLMTDIAANLMPWIEQNEIDHVMSGLRCISSAKLIQMDEQLRNKETTYKQKALITKTLLTQGYLHHVNKKIKTQLIVQPLCLLATIGSLAFGVNAMLKKDDRAVLASGGMFALTYLISAGSKKKFDQETNEARHFLKILFNNEPEKNRVDAEHAKWFQTNANQGAKR